MQEDKQSRGRERNAATPGGKLEADIPDEAVLRVGRQSRRRAGPDGPDAREVGDTFKKKPEAQYGATKQPS